METFQVLFVLGTRRENAGSMWLKKIIDIFKTILIFFLKMHKALLSFFKLQEYPMKGFCESTILNLIVFLTESFINSNRCCRSEGYSR